MALTQFLEEYWGDNYEVYEELRTAVCDLCAAFDYLVETHRKAHMLTGNVSEVRFFNAPYISTSVSP